MMYGCRIGELFTSTALIHHTYTRVSGHYAALKGLDKAVPATSSSSTLSDRAASCPTWVDLGPYKAV